MATKSIGTTGRDYSTVALWLASLPATLTEAEIGECYNDSEFAENIALGAGITTSGSNTLTLRAAAGQGIADHADKDTNPLVYDQSKGVGFRTTDAVILLNTSSANTVVEGLQFFKDQSGYGNVALTRHLPEKKIVVWSKLCVCPPTLSPAFSAFGRT